MISPNIKRQIIDQTNIVEVVGEVVKLTKKGSSYFGLCPFHNDKNPSMSVNSEKKMFNCFSCNTKGNVIYFLSRFNNISEDQATITLAKRLGIEISEANTKEAIKQERLYKVMNEATNFYQFYLNNSDEGVVAKQYLLDRGITEEIAKELKIGLSAKAPNYLNLALRQKNFSELDQTELGLVKINDNNEAYDVFKNRIMFPIENGNGQVVGFSGRIYEKSNQAKYINSTDNAIFHKGQILYNFHNASNHIRENNKIIIYEGFMDVIASIKANMKYAVATMGTALTNDHIKMILNLTKNITLCFDGDEAGLKAMRRSAYMFANFNIMPKAVVLPNGMDPDEYIKAYGVEKLQEYFKTNEKNVYLCLYELAKKAYIPSDIETLESFKTEVFTFLRQSKQNTIIEHFLKELANDTNISYETLISDFGSIKSLDIEQHLPIVNENNDKNLVKVKNVNIKRKVFLAYDVLLKHMINSKDKFIEFRSRLKDELYLDSSLSIYFDFVKKIEIYYAENNQMDEQDFLEMAKKLDFANGTNMYVEFAEKILNYTICNIKDNSEFIQCLDTIVNCYLEISNTKLYNKAIISRSKEDIKNFENIRKKNVRIMSKED